MLGQSGHHVQAVTMVTDGSQTSAFFIGGANKIVFEVPTFSAGGLITATANVYAWVSKTATGTFRPVADMGVYSGSSGIDVWEYPSTTGNVNIVCRPITGFDFCKIRISNTATAMVSFNVHTLY